MKILRYVDPATREERWGCLEGETVHALSGDPLGDPERGPAVAPLASLRLGPPCRPGKVIAAAINYRGATDWQEGMTEPLFFFKSPNSICGPQDDIVSPFADAPTWGEPELVVVLGRRVRDADPKTAAAAIFGYTIANDASAENIGPRDHHLPRSKAADTYCPLGHYIDTEYDPRDKKLEGFHNALLARKGSTKDLFWDPVRLVVGLSSWMTLEPWDLILTASPPMITPMTYFEDGDTYTIRVEGFPELRTRFRQRRPLTPETRARWPMRRPEHV